MAEFTRQRKIALAGPWTTYGVVPRASVTTALAGDNNDLTFTSKDRGVEAHDIRVRYVVAGNSTPLSVAVTGRDVTVNVATDGVGAPTSTAAQVRDAVNADAAASALVTAANATGNDGTGVVAALGYTNLAGGRVSLGRGSGATRQVRARGTNLNG